MYNKKTETDTEKSYSIKSPTMSKYFEEQRKYTEIYGEKTIVFFEMGKFYDAYCTDTEGYVNLAELQNLLNIEFIKRELGAPNNPYNKPSQFGIHGVTLKDKLEKLVEAGYTIPLFQQKGTGKNIERECVGIYSQGTHITGNSVESNHMMSIYIVEEEQLFSKKNLMAIGLTIIDATTGFSTVYEFFSDRDDENYGLDELCRTLQIFRPVELIVYFKPAKNTVSNPKLFSDVVKDIKRYIDIDRYKNAKFYTWSNGVGTDPFNLLSDLVFKISYQNDYLAEVFKLNNQSELKNKTSPLEILNLERKTYAAISMMIVLKYISDHDTVLLSNLNIPEIYVHDKHLVLGNNAIEQLNIIDSNGLDTYNNRFKSVFDVVNKAVTPMGRRYLKTSLCNPLSQENKATIIQRYDIIEQLLTSKSDVKLYKDVQYDLKFIGDIERLHRKMSMGMMLPNDLFRLDQFYQAATRVIDKIKDNQIIRNLCPDTIVNKFLELQFKLWKEYDVEKLQQYRSFSDISESFFHKGIYEDLDDIQDELDYVQEAIESTRHYLTSFVKKKDSAKKFNFSKAAIDFEHNERDGYHFTVTKANEKILKQKLDSEKNIIVPLNIGKDFKFKSSDVKFKQLPKGRTKIFIKPLSKYTDKLIVQKSELIKLIKTHFIKSTVDYFEKYRQIMISITKFITEIDFLASGASVADAFYYCRPSIPHNNNVPSYIHTSKLRHAIIERLNEETEYVPNDMTIGNVPDNLKESDIGYNGVLIFGTNSAGKSSLMKAVGVATILAQIGYYVPATSFEYEPYMSLYARITGNDNIYKGQSSFSLEMCELDAILTRTEKQGDRTLIIGDEICRGTEDKSGVSIVSSAIVSLSNNNTTFIFSSHLHKVPEIQEVAQLTNLRLFHLRVENDIDNDCLVFNRVLTEGSGPGVYGLNFARHIIKNKEFLKRAEKIMDRLNTDMPSEIPVKKSNYNSKKIVKKCDICKYVPKSDMYKELESHHISFQKDCRTDGKIKEKPYLSKNRLYNLTVLCRRCHQRVHNGSIIIKGYLDTSIGPILDYSYNIDIEKMLKRKIEKGIKDIQKLDEIFYKETRNKTSHHKISTRRISAMC